MVVHHAVTGLTQRIGFAQEVADVTFAGNGRLLVTVDDLVALVDPESGEGAVIARFDTTARAAAPVSDGLVVCASIGADVRIVDLQGRTAASLTGSSHYVQALAAQPGGSMFATGHWDGTVILWNAATLRPQVTFRAQRIVIAVAFSPDGQHLLSLGYDSLHLSTAVWDVPTPEECRALAGRPLTGQAGVEPSHIWRLAERQTSHQGNAGIGAHIGLARGGAAYLVNADAQPTLYATDTGAQLAQLAGEARTLAYAAAGTLVRTADGVAWFAFEDGHLTPLGLPGGITWEGISLNGRHLLGTDETGAVRVYDRQSGQFGAELRSPDILVDDAPFAAAAGEHWCVTDDGRYAACSSSEHEVFVWNATTGACISSVTDLVTYPRNLSFTGDGTRLLVAVGSRTLLGSVTVIDLPTP
ncbi:WD40 repeat domain-containing protein [Deinococcus arcticus]|uniref:Uncharacterized protein n=1 Tax=Deinococcus arcticus TaxID=2136176 RepID=A0A2T3W3J7_9DEIO|nr:WD40 repeat domain-containing protein [Deinococcus arcticus]PTA66465.1 hypothetical protein C8263_17670 [Deinococcus arcticus]